MEKNRELDDYRTQRAGYQKAREHLVEAPSMRVADCIVKLLNQSQMPLRVRVGLEAKLVYHFKKALPGAFFTWLMRKVYQYKFLS